MVLGVVLVVAALAYSFRFQSFMHAKELVWAIGAPVAAVVGWRGLRDAGGIRAFLPLWILLGLALVIHTVLVPAQLPERVVESGFRYGLILGIAALFVAFVRDDRARRRVDCAFIVSATLVAGLALLQYARLAPFLFPEFPNYPQRAYSVFGNQDLLGGYVAIGIAATLVRVAESKASPRWAWLSLPILTAALLISGSRSAWLAAAAGCLVLVLRKDTHRRTLKMLLLAAVPAAIVACVIAPHATVTRFTGVFAAEDLGAWLRLWFWDGTLRMIADHPFVGVGPGNYAYWSPRYLGEALFAYEGFRHVHNEVHTLHAHNEWFELVAETGFVGVVCVGWQAWRMRVYRGLAWTPTIVVLVFMLFNTISHSIPHIVWLLYLVACMLPLGAARASGGTGLSALPPVAIVFLGAAGLVGTTIVPSFQLRRAEETEPMDPAAYEAAIAYPWPNADAEFAYGMALFGAGDDEDARTRLDRALRGNDTGAIHLALAILAHERGDAYAAAFHALRAYLRWPTDPNVRDVYFRRVDQDVATELWKTKNGPLSY